MFPVSVFTVTVTALYSPQILNYYTPVSHNILGQEYDFI